ncbi:ABC transporter permease [Chitinophaga nivalis]|uniref:FtsX-like permease family protein n=1 Tax=Chitinophaga nivalis TaxID=2991709 RepID=A0ABT3IMW2_9BACT|nr:FtsX-like permease family protein [Chitinophaga nivalis]MCW3465001.1 FtsX-like permease family protein [Chitinophaga nivalis]MCW3485307.1 FtsX-like permease family protein [Chitinophaga nivalis]
MLFSTGIKEAHHLSGNRKPPDAKGKYVGRHLYQLHKLGYRNLFRNRRRSFFAILIAACGFAALGIALGYYDYSIYGLQEATIRNGFSGAGGTGHAQIRDARLKEREEQYLYEFGIANAPALLDRLRNMPEIADVLPRIMFGGLISNGDKSMPFKGQGIHPDGESRLRNGMVGVDKSMKASSQLQPLNKSKAGVILGKRLARSLNAKVGDILMIYGTTVDGAINGIDVTLMDIVSTGISEVDEYYLMTTIPVVQQLVNTDKISYIAVMFKNRAHLNQQLAALAGQLKTAFPDYRFQLSDWKNDAEFYAAIRDTYTVIITFMGSIVLVIVALSCWNIMNMSTMERIREIGTLRAIGISIHKISGIFLFEALYIGLISVVVGMLLQLLVAALLNAANIMMPPIPGMNRGYILQIYSLTFYHLLIAVGVILAIAFSSLSSFLIIRKLSIIQSLEHA